MHIAYIVSVLRELYNIHEPGASSPIFFSTSRGDSQILQKGGVVALLWRDNRVVTLLSTNAQPQQSDSVQRRESDGTRRSVPCPAAMALYNTYMGGVDRNDQLRGYYHVRMKCRKFYRYIFWFLFEVSIANAHILHSRYSGAEKRQKFKEFRLELARSLVGDYHSKKRLGRCSAAPTILPLRHYPLRYVECPDSTPIRRRCWYCQHHRQQRRDTQWFCRECNIHLCHTGIIDTDCFMQYHKDIHSFPEHVQ